MAAVGIIANPVSGKDIRRLVAHGSVFDNQEKVRMVRRALMGLSAVGVRQVAYMPDYYAILDRAMRGCTAQVKLVAAAVSIQGHQDDSTRSARWMAQNDVRCVLVLGGDGTCRAVAKGAGEMPLLPLSTGTNNVFPGMIEATVAGMAAGLTAMGKVPARQGMFRSCRLDILNHGQMIDQALVDVAVYRDRFIASRAVWDIEKVSQIFLTRCRPENIGLSAIGGQLTTIEPHAPSGLRLQLGNGGREITAAIAPGLIATVGIENYRSMAIGDAVRIDDCPSVLALDGEREVTITKNDRISVRLSDQGPWVIDVAKTMAIAREGSFSGN